MSAGLSNILAQSQRSTGGPPFAANAADNGLSIDPVTGRIVLGNDVGGLLAALLSDREIFSNDHDIVFRGSATEYLTLFARNGSTVAVTLNEATTQGSITNSQVLLQDLLFASQISLTIVNPFDSSNTPGVDLNNGGNAFTRLQQVADAFEIVQQSATQERFLSVDRNADIFQFGDIDGAVNGNRLVIDDNLGTFAIENTGLNARVVINGVNGFTGTVAPVNTITVDGGIVTNVA